MIIIVGNAVKGKRYVHRCAENEARTTLAAGHRVVQARIRP